MKKSFWCVYCQTDTGSNKAGDACECGHNQAVQDELDEEKDRKLNRMAEDWEKIRATLLS